MNPINQKNQIDLMNLMNIYFLVQEFYAIEAISAMLSGSQGNGFEPMRRSHSVWYRDFTAFRDRYITQFASAIFDYTVLVVSAELRHGNQKASQYIKEYYASWQSREEVYDVSSVYKANDILTAGIRMFDTGLVAWRRGYGGEKWKQIAKAGLMKGKISDCVFIDHCVDLSHNNSIYFDKRAGIFFLQDIVQYQEFLDLKRSCEPQTLINEKLGYTFNRLLWRAKNLNIIEGKQAYGLVSPDYDKAESLLFGYHPVKWGGKRLDYSEGNIITRENLDDKMRRKWDDERDYERDYDRGNDREYDQAA